MSGQSVQTGDENAINDCMSQ